MVKSFKDAAASELAEARGDDRKQSIVVNQTANELTPTRSPPGKRAKKLKEGGYHHNSRK